jgi:hypothetical protein
MNIVFTTPFATTLVQYFCREVNVQDCRSPYSPTRIIDNLASSHIAKKYNNQPQHQRKGCLATRKKVTVGNNGHKGCRVQGLGDAEGSSTSKGNNETALTTTLMSAGFEAGAMEDSII